MNDNGVREAAEQSETVAIQHVQVGADTNARTADASVEDFDKRAAINTRGIMLCLRAVSKGMAVQDPLMHRRVNAICSAWVDKPVMVADLDKQPELKGIIQAVSPFGGVAVP
ncbi:MAG: hypothetical protein ASARMPRED_005721 [Alectoria sarmentosa]|nr:MAG: hypothetical protein ASARMPRED_005721 [Alectoria sarmentosa]